jgi:rare lipoprotein A
MRLPVSYALPLAALVLVSGCAGAGNAALEPLARSGPAADYPVVIGAPYRIEAVDYAPADRLNHDAVGHAAVGSDGGAAVSIAHQTLPLPSYAEITALDSGQTILVRVERRGPMRNDRLVELSPGAAAQLGLAGQDSAAIRIRRVNPPEAERALLRSGERVPERMATPPGLLAVLKRKLAPLESPLAPDNTTLAEVAPAAVLPAATLRPVAPPVPKSRPEPAKPHATGPSLQVQIGTYANPQNAGAAASKAGGKVQAAGRLSRVVVGPFADRGTALAALAKARSAGYSDARIQRAD